MFCRDTREPCSSFVRAHWNTACNSRHASRASVPGRGPRRVLVDHGARALKLTAADGREIHHVHTKGLPTHRGARMVCPAPRGDPRPAHCAAAARSPALYERGLSARPQPRACHHCGNQSWAAAVSAKCGLRSPVPVTTRRGLERRFPCRPRDRLHGGLNRHRPLACAVSWSSLHCERGCCMGAPLPFTAHGAR